MNAVQLTTGQCATLACLLEVTAPKPGNVHRAADFDDLSLNDLVASAVAIGPAMDGAGGRAVGETVLAAVRATRQVACTNTNLGTVLLLAPLAAVPRDVPLAAGVAGLLGRLSANDARQVYQAIRLARPGGLGQVGQMDVAGEAPADLLEAMRAAAGRDLVAQQYVDGFSAVLTWVVPWLKQGKQAGWSLSSTIVHSHVRLMSRCPDSLIARKCGVPTARRSAELARAVLEAGSPGDAAYDRALSNLDFWLRSDGHRRNPGTTADLIAAGLFAALRDAIIEPPFR